MKISIVLAAMTGNFETDMNRASKTAQKRMKEIEKTAKQVGAAVGLALTAAATGAAVAIKAAINRADELSKTAQKIGVTTEALSALAYAAQLADVDLGTLQAGLGRLTKFQSDAAAGTEKNIALFKALGIEFKNADGTLRNTEEVFRDLARVFQALPDGANKTALALDVFGRSGANLIPMLNGGADGLDQMRQRAEELGIIVDTETGRAAEQFNDQLSDLKLATTGLATAVAAELLPDLIRLVDKFTQATNSGDGFKSTANTIAEAIRGMGLAAQAAVDSIQALVFIGAGLSEVAEGLNPYANITNKMLGRQTGTERFENAGTAFGMVPGAFDETSESLFGGGAGGGIEWIDPPKAKAAAAGVDEINAALERYRAGTTAAAAATGRKTETDREAAKAAQEQARARAEAYDEIQRVFKAEQEAIREEVRLKEEAKKLVDDTLADIAFETKLLGLNNLEREKAIALRYANADAASKEGKDIAAALDDLDKARKVAEGMDVLRGATETLFSDLMSGTMSAKDAFMSFVDSILAGIARIIAQNFTENLFGSFGSAGGGSSGGGLASLFGSLFGGGKAGGGPVSMGTPYLVGENGPELFIPPANGTIANSPSTRRMMGGGGATINFNMPGRYDLRTQGQIAADTARVLQKSTGRSTA